MTYKDRKGGGRRGTLDIHTIYHIHYKAQREGAGGRFVIVRESVQQQQKQQLLYGACGIGPPCGVVVWTDKQTDRGGRGWEVSGTAEGLIVQFFRQRLVPVERWGVATTRGWQSPIAAAPPPDPWLVGSAGERAVGPARASLATDRWGGGGVPHAPLASDAAAARPCRFHRKQQHDTYSNLATYSFPLEKKQTVR